MITGGESLERRGFSYPGSRSLGESFGRMSGRIDLFIF